MSDFDTQKQWDDWAKRIRKERKAAGYNPTRGYFWHDTGWPFVRGLLVIVAFLLAGGILVAATNSGTTLF